MVFVLDDAFAGIFIYLSDVTKTGNEEWGMGNGEWGMGNGEWGMGNGEWEIVVSGNT